MFSISWRVIFLVIFCVILNYWLLFLSLADKISMIISSQGITLAVQSYLEQNTKYSGNISAIERSLDLGDDEFFIHLQATWPNLPVLHWKNNKDKKVSNKCFKIPNILDLHYSNKYWQVKQTSDGTFYLYAAYYDVRKVPGLYNC